MAEDKKKKGKAAAEEPADEREKDTKPAKEKKMGKKKDEDDEPRKEKKGKKEKKEKKGHPVIKTFFGTSLFWLALFSVASFIVYFNLTPLNPKEVVLQLLNPEEDFEVVFGDEIESLRDYETELDELAAELDAYSYELDGRSDELDEWESQLEDLQYELEERFPNIFDEDAQENVNLTDILSVAKSVAAMTPKNAANALIEASMDVGILILNSMKPEERAAILDEMPTEDASAFIEAMASPE